MTVSGNLMQQPIEFWSGPDGFFFYIHLFKNLNPGAGGLGTYEHLY